ncbi:unnamed protein product [Allacma fusca]|uniref:Uncharacterized protein n=1 Tax=Allacma fusca TaxID=39272 RepID=A0A8J2PJ24_9HEXA|nr:unnamed protein product [Allacma fusca]
MVQFDLLLYNLPPMPYIPIDIYLLSKDYFYLDLWFPKPCHPFSRVIFLAALTSGYDNFFNSVLANSLMDNSIETDPSCLIPTHLVTI